MTPPTVSRLLAFVVALLLPLLGGVAGDVDAHERPGFLKGALGFARLRVEPDAPTARWLGGLGHARELATPRCPEICTIQIGCRVETRSRSLRVGWGASASSVSS